MEELSVSEYLKKSKEPKNYDDISIELIEDVYQDPQGRSEGKHIEKQPELPEVIEILKMVRLLKSQVELLIVTDLPESKSNIVKQALIELFRVARTYCERDQ